MSADAWVRMPVWVMRAPVSPLARILWAYLDDAGRRGWTPGTRAMARDLGASRSAVQSAVRALVDAGMLTVTGGGGGARSSYRTTAPQTGPETGPPPGPELGPEPDRIPGHPPRTEFRATPDRKQGHPRTGNRAGTGPETGPHSEETQKKPQKKSQSRARVGARTHTHAHAREARPSTPTATARPDDDPLTTWELVATRFGEWRLAAGGGAFRAGPRQYQQVEAVAEWVDAEAERTGRTRRQCLDALLDAYQADEWARSRGYPLGALASDPGARIGTAEPEPTRGIALADEAHERDLARMLAEDAEAERRREARRRARRRDTDDDPAAAGDLAVQLLASLTGGRK